MATTATMTKLYRLLYYKPNFQSSMALHRPPFILQRPFLRPYTSAIAQPILNRRRTFQQALPILTFQFIGFYATLLFIWTSVLSISHVTGPSMYPFLNTDAARTTTRDRVVIWRWRSKLGVPGGRPGPDVQADSTSTTNNAIRGIRAHGDMIEAGYNLGLERGDIIAFRSPMTPERDQIKRVIALPGDLVQTHAPYPKSTEFVPQGHVWVEGDQPEDGKTYDSNYYGPISANLVVGRVVGVVWPWYRRGWCKAEAWKCPPGKVVRGSAIEGMIRNVFEPF